MFAHGRPRSLCYDDFFCPYGKNAPIIILNEATANENPENEKAATLNGPICISSFHSNSNPRTDRLTGAGVLQNLHDFRKCSCLISSFPHRDAQLCSY